MYFDSLFACLSVLITLSLPVLYFFVVKEIKEHKKVENIPLVKRRIVAN